MANTKAFVVATIGIIFILISITTLSYDSFCEGRSCQNGDVVVRYSQDDINNILYNNITSDNNGDAESSLALNQLNVFDYLLRILDTFTIGLYFINSGIIGVLLRLMVLLPMQIIFYWVGLEMIRGN